MSTPIAVFRDDFENNVIDPCWTKATSGSATGAETGGQAVFTLPSSMAGSHEAHYISNARNYDLTGDAANFAIGTMVATGVAASAYMQLYMDASNLYDWIQTSGTLKARKTVAGVTTDLFSVAWSATTYKYLRIRESGGTVYFDSSTSASGGASWTNRASTTIASAFPVTALFVYFGASCGNVASPGSFKLDDFNPILPLTAGTWRDTTADWQIKNRHRSTTIAATANAQGVIVTADTMDASRVLSGNLRYFAGPLGSASGGYLALTEYASLALAQASPFPIPVNGRVDLPALVDARFMRLYHRSTDGASHTIREFVPRRIVQADDIEAESITAINIAAHTITADQIGTVNLDATARITAGGGVVTLDDQGITIAAIANSSYAAPRALTWEYSGNPSSHLQGYVVLNTGSSSNKTRNALWQKARANTTSEYGMLILESESLVTGVSANPSIEVRGYDGLINSAGAITVISGDLTLTAGGNFTITNGVNVGTATSAEAGQVRTSGYVMTSGAGTLPASAVMAMAWDSGSTRGLLVAINNGTYQRLDIEGSDVRFKYQTTIRIQANSTGLGFFAAAPVAKPTVTGSRGGNAALASALTALANLGLLTDSSTA